MPEGGQIGDRVIGGKTVVVTEQTQLNVMRGEITTGVCVKVHWMAQGSTTAHEIERENPSDCNRGGDDHGDDGGEVYGIVEAMPMSGTVGVWTVSSQVYSVTEQTNLRRSMAPSTSAAASDLHGPPARLRRREMGQTERSYKCDGHHDDDAPPAASSGGANCTAN